MCTPPVKSPQARCWPLGDQQSLHKVLSTVSLTIGTCQQETQVLRCHLCMYMYVASWFAYTRYCMNFDVKSAIICLCLEGQVTLKLSQLIHM